MSETKQCSKCGEVKEVEFFRQTRRSCKACDELQKKKYRESNRERYLEACKKYRESNEEKHRKACKKHYESNKEKYREYKTKARATLSDSYIKAAICYATGIPVYAVPQFLIEVKRKHLQILRKIKEPTNER